MWDVVGADFTSIVLKFFLESKMDKALNMTWVTLIPKFEGAKEMNDYRPISMVGCEYKVIAKVLSRRIRNVMSSLVGEVQTAFIQDRKILDGPLIACELVHWIKKAKKEGIIVKLDFRRAYDPVRWCFIDQVLQKMGFGSVWRGWIQCCLSTAAMSVLVNGPPTKPFKMKKGLRQGDLSFPFSICISSRGTQ